MGHDHEECTQECDACDAGARFTSLEELRQLLPQFLGGSPSGGEGAGVDLAGEVLQCRPRGWVMEYMSDEAAVLYALHTIGLHRDAVRVGSGDVGRKGRDQAATNKLREWRQRQTAEMAGSVHGGVGTGE